MNKQTQATIRTCHSNYLSNIYHSPIFSICYSCHSVWLLNIQLTCMKPKERRKEKDKKDSEPVQPTISNSTSEAESKRKKPKNDKS